MSAVPFARLAVLAALEGGGAHEGSEHGEACERDGAHASQSSCCGSRGATRSRMRRTTASSEAGDATTS